jgi:hypothetical protein
MEPSPLERNLTPRAFADFLATEHMQGDGLDDDLMREIMGVQVSLHYSCMRPYATLLYEALSY